MKAGILAVAVATLGVALWLGDFLTPPAGDMRIGDAVVHPGMGGQVNAVLTIQNDGAPDELLSVASPDARVALQNADEGLPIQTGGSSLSMDGAYISVSSNAPLEDGALLPLTLSFAKAGDVNISARYMTPEPGSMEAHMAMGHAMMLEPAAGEPIPAIALTVTPSDAGWTAQIETENFTFAEELQDSGHVPGTGHGHIYAGSVKLGRVFGNTYRIGALPKGEHTIRVSLNTNNHRSYAVDGQPVEATATITVD
ncbi:hypothetical protein [Yoonia sp. 2307UL14-13]|uniref:hypothetical protein n=1 Tax=Yoonia sp. 2307UL14-13 TaxID=3126506 RepID=UPI0030A657D7